MKLTRRAVMKHVTVISLPMILMLIGGVVLLATPHQAYAQAACDARGVNCIKTTAANMAAGTFVDITPVFGPSWQSGRAFGPTQCPTQSLAQYAASLVWNAATHRLQYVGSPHGCFPNLPNGRERAVFYDDTTNTWGDLPMQPDWADGQFSHAYGHNAMNSVTGDHYYQPYNSTANLVLRNGASGWTRLAVWPNNTQVAQSQVWFPDRNTLVRWDGDWGLAEWSASANKWTFRAAGLAAGCGGVCVGAPQFSCGASACYSTWAVYSIRCHCVVFGQLAAFGKLNADGSTTALNWSGSALPTCMNATTSNGCRQPTASDSADGGSAITVDPVSGEVLVIPNGQSRIYAFDPGTTNASTGSWRIVPGATVPEYFNGPGLKTNEAGGPIAEYGVTIWIATNDLTSTGRFFLYKHAPSTPQATPGAPGAVVVR